MAMNNPHRETTSVEKAEALLAEMKDRAMEAHRTGDQFTMSLMQELIKVTSPIVTKAVARFHRAERSRINNLARELREQSPRQQGQTPNQSRPNATTRLGD
jgi:hypothetical protein